MFPTTKGLALTFALGLTQVLPTVAISQGNSDLNYPPSVNDTPHSAPPGTVRITVQCPESSKSIHVLSEWLSDTSIEAVAPLMEHWNKLAMETSAKITCKGAKKAQMVLKTSVEPLEQRSDIGKPGLVQVIASCSDGSNTKTILSQYLSNTSIEAAWPMFELWNEFAAQARDEVDCADGSPPVIRLQGREEFDRSTTVSTSNGFTVLDVETATRIYCWAMGIIGFVGLIFGFRKW